MLVDLLTKKFSNSSHFYLRYLDYLNHSVANISTWFDLLIYLQFFLSEIVDLSEYHYYVMKYLLQLFLLMAHFVGLHQFLNSWWFHLNWSYFLLACWISCFESFLLFKNDTKLQAAVQILNVRNLNYFIVAHEELNFHPQHSYLIEDCPLSSIRDFTFMSLRHNYCWPMLVIGDFNLDFLPSYL